MLVYTLYTIFFLSCIILVVSILLQPGKTDAGALFTSNIASTAFGPRGTTTILAKITIGTAIVFFLSALLLSIPAITGEISVLQRTTSESSQMTEKEEEQKSQESQTENNKQAESKQTENQQTQGTESNDDQQKDSNN
jgi:protein translocase SecG subunit